MKYPKCEIRWCIGGDQNRAVIRVTENVGDGAYATFICRPCADAIGVRGNDDLPEPDLVKQLLERHEEARKRSAARLSYEDEKDLDQMEGLDGW